MKYFIGLQSNRVDIYRPKQLGLGYSIHRNVFPPFKNNICIATLFYSFLLAAISIATAISNSPILAFKTAHCEFLEYWNTQKSVWRIWQHFSCLLDKGIPNIWKKLNYHSGFLRAFWGREKCAARWAELAVLFCR